MGGGDLDGELHIRTTLCEGKDRDQVFAENQGGPKITGKPSGAEETCNKFSFKIPEKVSLIHILTSDFQLPELQDHKHLLLKHPSAGQLLYSNPAQQTQHQGDRLLLPVRTYNPVQRKKKKYILFCTSLFVQVIHSGSQRKWSSILIASVSYWQFLLPKTV